MYTVCISGFIWYGITVSQNTEDTVNSGTYTTVQKFVDSKIS